MYDVLEELQTDFRDLQELIKDYYKHRKLDLIPFHNEGKEAAKKYAITLIDEYIIQELEELSELLKGAK